MKTAIKKCADENWLVIIPTGCTEQQGPHLPIDFDTWFVEELSLAVSEFLQQEYSISSLVLPALPFGPTPEHRGFGSGYIDLPQEVHELVVTAVLDSLIEQGFRRLVIWRGCGQHELSQVVERYNVKFSGKVTIYHPDLPFHRIWCETGDPSIPGGHADSFATSIALYKRPQSVRKDKISNPNSQPVDWNDPDLDFSKYSNTGVIGDPTYATAELGNALWENSVRAIGKILKDAFEK